MYEPEHKVDSAGLDPEHQHSGQRRNISVVKAVFRTDQCLAPAVS